MVQQLSGKDFFRETKHKEIRRDGLKGKKNKGEITKNYLYKIKKNNKHVVNGAF